MLRLEAQETWDKEHIELDPLTQLITKDSMLIRLKEKIENSKRSGFPFSVVFISLADFDHKNNLVNYEMEAILRGMADFFKEDIRAGVDIAARMAENDFLIAIPGSPLRKAEEIAARFKQDIVEKVKAPRTLAVDVSVGVAEYSVQASELGKQLITTPEEVYELIEMADKNSRL
ncbi:MAG: GGDEF domain-containing protein [Methylovulum sp.]|nr:GGDEF domain-containing protein [Methylovulum sp.]